MCDTGTGDKVGGPTAFVFCRAGVKAPPDQWRIARLSLPYQARANSVKVIDRRSSRCTRFTCSDSGPYPEGDKWKVSH